MTSTCPATGSDRILLSTDCSEFSEGAVREAIEIAQRCSGHLIALSVIDVNPELSALAPQITEQRDKEVRLYLGALKARANKAGITCDVIVHQGDEPYHFVVEEALKNKSTMIVMGRRGRTGLKRLMMGSVTARVIGHAPCNVLVVPKAAHPEFRNILIATDGSQYAGAATAAAIEMAKRNKGSLTVISVVPAELATPTDIDFAMGQKELIAEKEMQYAEKNATAVKNAATQAGIPVRAFVMSGRPADTIVETANEKKADLIVLGSHGRTGLEKLIMGSVTERVIVLSSCAVMVVKKYT